MIAHMFNLSPGMQGFLGGAAAVGIPLFFILVKEIILIGERVKQNALTSASNLYSFWINLSVNALKLHGIEDLIKPFKNLNPLNI